VGFFYSAISEYESGWNISILLETKPAGGWVVPEWLKYKSLFPVSVVGELE
jgi:hypothetical protein